MEEVLIEGEEELFESLRSRRLEQLATQGEESFSPSETVAISEEFGYLSEISHEKEIMHMSTTLPRLIVHFYSSTFRSCQILNDHLRKLARKYPKTRFVYIDATKAPFLVVKMKVQMLPCLICIVDSIVADRMVGFDDLGGVETFTTRLLEDRLASQSRIFQVFGKFKVSADRRDLSESEDDDY